MPPPILNQEEVEVSQQIREHVGILSKHIGEQLVMNLATMKPRVNWNVRESLMSCLGSVPVVRKVTSSTRVEVNCGIQNS